MEKFTYLSDKKITIGGRAVPASDLSTLNPKTLELAVNQKVIKKIKDNGKHEKQEPASEE